MVGGGQEAVLGLGQALQRSLGWLGCKEGGCPAPLEAVLLGV
jgi:hypothetical protein